MSDDPALLYHLPRCSLEITGEVTSQTNLTTGERERKATSSLLLVTEADTDDYYEINLKESGLVDSNFNISLTEDGRLTSTSAVHSGRLGDAIKGIVSFATNVGALVLPRPMLLEDQKAEDHPPTTPSELSWEKENQTLADRLKQLELTANELADYMGTAASPLHKDVDRSAKATALQNMYGARAALKIVRDEISLVQAHKDAWTAAKINKETETFRFKLALSDLLPSSKIQSAIDSGKDLDKLLTDPDLKKVHKNLRVIVGIDRRNRPDAKLLNLEKKPGLGAALHGVLYRIPYKVDLVVFGYETGGDHAKLKELSRSENLITDDQSSLSFVRFDKSVWGDRSATVEFSERGALTKLAASGSAAIADAAAALGALPEEVSAALERANKIIDEHQTLRNQGLDQTLARLETERKVIDEKIAADSSLARLGQAGALAELDQEKQRLQAYKDIGELSRDLTASRSTYDLVIKKELETLQKDLEQLELDRLKISQELEIAESTSAARLEKAIEELRSQIDEIKNG